MGIRSVPTASRQRRRRLVPGLVLGLALLAAPPLAAETPKVAPGAPAEPARLVDINAAGVEELSTLPGIGKTTAERIVAFREKHGPFRRVEDLIRVKGIGEKSFQKLRTRITVSSPR